MRDPLHSRLLKFDQKFRGIDLANYYQLNKDSTSETSISTQVDTNRIHLRIRYKKREIPQILPLPVELIRMVYGYLTYRIEIETSIEYSNQYPFAPPIWFIGNVTHTLPRNGYDPFYLLDYYIEKINYHNHLYNIYLLEGTQWTPAITVEKDILMFLQRIFHFDEMIA